MERKNVEHLPIHVEVATCATMEFNNLFTINEKCCQIKKGMRKKMKTHESKTCLLFVYCFEATIVL
jgi:hypothetical protein